jgi:hypothetical protein
MPRLVLAFWLLLIGWWTLTPAPAAMGAVDLTPWWCVSCGEIGTADLFQNLVLFLPVGLLLRTLGWSAPRAILSGLVATLGIEAIQAAFLPGRDAALGDVLANLAGTAGGWLLLPTLRAMVAPTVRTANRLAATMLVAFAGQLLLSAVLLRPAPGNGDWSVERAPRHRDGTQWSGGVGLVSLDRAGDTVAFITTSTWPTSPPDRRATVARLTRGPGDDVAGISVARDALSAGIRTRATTVRLRSPVGEIALPPLAPGDTLTVRVSHRPGELALSATSSSGAGRTMTVPIGAQHGWVLINPFTPSVELTREWFAWTLAWLVGWGVLLGWGAGASRRWAGWALGALGIGLALPWLTGTPLAAREVAVLAAAWAAAACGSKMRARGHPIPE